MDARDRCAHDGEHPSLSRPQSTPALPQKRRRHLSSRGRAEVVAGLPHSRSGLDRGHRQPCRSPVRLIRLQRLAGVTRNAVRSGSIRNRMTTAPATAEGCSPESLPDVPVAAPDALHPALASNTWLPSVAVGFRMTERIVVVLTGLALAGLVVLVPIGLWDRHQRETATYPAGAPGRTPAAGREQPAPPQGLQLGKLVASGATGSASQGMSIALSADGSTAIVGGPGPNNADSDRSPSLGPVGAAWVFVRDRGGWTQEGSKLVGATSDHGGGLWSQGASVALSADGSTAIVGGPSDNSTTGAAWVFTRSGGVWTQQGDKLVGTRSQSTGKPALPLGQGMSVALSADGNTAIVGGWRTEAAWVFTRVDGVWSKEGQKLVGSGAVGSARQGASVALSADGSTAIVGGWSDNGRIGAAWVFTRSGRGAWSSAGKEARRHQCRGTRRPRHLGRTVRRRQHRHRGRARRQPVGSVGAVRPRRRRSGVGVHPHQRCLDTTRQQAGGGQGERPSGHVGGAVRRRQHRRHGRVCRGRGRGRGIGLHPQGRPLDPRPEAGRQRRCGKIGTRGRAVRRWRRRDGRGFERQRRGRCGVGVHPRKRLLGARQQARRAAEQAHRTFCDAASLWERRRDRGS